MPGTLRVKIQFPQTTKCGFFEVWNFLDTRPLQLADTDYKRY